MAKSLGYYTYTGVQTVTSGSTLPLVNTVRQYGNCIRRNNNSIALISSCGCNGTAERAAGYYTISVNTTLTASAAGTITVSLYQDGQSVPGAVQTATVAAGEIVNFGFTAPVRVYCGRSESSLSVYMSGQSVNTVNVAVEAVKE